MRANNFYFPYWVIAIIISYLISYLLVRSKRLSLINQRRFWNGALGLFFLATAILGILLVIRMQYQLQINLPFNMVFWHVETGIGFAVIALFHIAWHWPYLKAMLKK